MKKILFSIAALIVIIGGAYGMWMKQSPSGSSGTPPPPPPAAINGTPVSIAPKTYTISMTAAGFSPSELTIKKGDGVNFVNDDKRQRWPASDPHPTHTLCPGFDAQEPVSPGGTYQHTFAEAKVCTFHDHIIPTLRGAITITE